MKTLTKPSKLRDTVKAMGDRELHELIVVLKFNTKLEQATLVHALAERRRRARASKKAKAAG